MEFFRSKELFQVTTGISQASALPGEWLFFNLQSMYVVIVFFAKFLVYHHLPALNRTVELKHLADLC